MPMTLHIVQIRSVAHRLAQANSLRSSPEHARRVGITDRLIADLENEILDGAKDEAWTSGHIRTDLLLTGSQKIVEKVLEASPRPVEISRREWASLINSSTPDLVDHMLDNGLSQIYSSLSLLRAIASGKSEWIPIMQRISREPTFDDNEVIEGYEVEILDNPIVTPLVATFLRNKVHYNLAHYTRLASSFVQTQEFYRAIVLHLAGVPIEAMRENYVHKTDAADAFYAVFDSNHALLDFRARFTSLEQFLTCGDLYTEWAWKLHQRAEGRD
jgi:hypothetical protein